MRVRALFASAVCLTFAACAAGPKAVAPTAATTSAAKGASASQEAFARQTGALYDAHFAFRPHAAVHLGLHAYDGKLPDYARGAIEREVLRLTAARKELEAVDPAALDEQGRIEREVLLSVVRGASFSLQTRREPFRNPMFYARPLNLVPYIARDYAPATTRARAISKVCAGVESYLSHAKENLPEAIPKTWLRVALMQFKGIASFMRKDVPAAVTGLDAATAASLHADLEQAASKVDAFVALLDSRRPKVTSDYALGKDTFLRMLEETQGVKVDLETLEAVGKRDLAKNLAAMDAVARTIDPKKSTRQVIDEVGKTHLTEANIFQVATSQGQALRQALLDKAIVSIPTADVVEVRPTPAFSRYNSAFLDSVGPFEEKALPSFYYITPPNPAWPEKKQREYLPAAYDLLFTSVHELWPGHFLDHLHVKKHPSKVLKSFWSYSRGEGWAHYAEQLMLEQGVGEGDPEVEIGQLLNALLRNVRYLSAIGLHAKGMTVEASAALFREKAFSDDATAMEQAVRGTFDPMYLSYTLGKLMILELREQVKAKEGGRYSLKGFHDRFLDCCGSAPIPVASRVMLGDGAKPPLSSL